MFSALQKTANVHIKHFAAHDRRLIQEQWVSRKLGIYREIDERHTAIYDTHKKIAKSKYFDTGKVEVWSLAGEELEAMKQSIASRRGQVPLQFWSESRIAEWSRLNSADLSAVPEGVEVYERTWQREDSNGSAVFNKWRIFVDRQIFLPRRTEFYQMGPGESEYTLASFHVYDYPGDEEFKAAINED